MDPADYFFLQDQPPAPVGEPEGDDYYRRAIAELDAAVDAGLMTVERTEDGPRYRLTEAGRAQLDVTEAAVLARLTDPHTGRRKT